MHEDPRTKYPKPGAQEKTQTFPGIEGDMVTKPEYGKDTYKGSGKLRGMKALVTGGDSGIGRSVAVAFAREGADVVIAYLPQEEKDAEVTLTEIRSAGQRAAKLPGNLEDEAYCNDLVPNAARELGGIDILINNAALQIYFTSIDAISAKDFARIYHVNVIAPFVLTKSAAALMPKGGAIVNTVSIQAYDPSSLLIAYAASKGAFVALTKAFAEQLIERGIRVNAIAPGPIWSPLNTHGSPPEKLKTFGERSSFGRPGQPIELAPLYVFLASPEASYITGEIFGITGGAGIA